MRKINQIQHISGCLDDNNVRGIINSLNNGYEIIKLDTSWQQESQPDGGLVCRPVVIAILAKYGEEAE